MDTRISLITLGVADLETSALFYEALGWTRVQTPDTGIVVFDLLGQALGLFPIEALAKEFDRPVETLGRGALTLAHNVASQEQVDAIMASAKAAGAEILTPARTVFWGGYSGYFSDPDGHIWEIAHNPFSTLGPNGEFRWAGY
ncbi:MAG: VOC family protein [Rhodobacteraceae bacterium]|nr:VOC family protein [Paracoccaceae bacterium]